jgi:hypothetical protein
MMLGRRELVLGGLALLAAKGAQAQGSHSTQSGRAAGRSPHWGPPYTAQELRAAEQRLGIRFPPDLFEFLLKRRFASSPDWTTDEQDVRGLLALPLEGIQFDIYKNDFWAPHWGERPASIDERFATVEKLVKAAPKLIPLAPDMFIPESPHRRGNPIFFVFLSDVRYFAANLEAYVERLATGQLRGPVTGPRMHIPFWTELSEVRPRVPPAKP